MSIKSITNLVWNFIRPPISKDHKKHRLSSYFFASKIILLSCISGFASAEVSISQAHAPNQDNEIPLPAPYRQTDTPESWIRINGTLGVRNVSQPSLIPVLPEKGQETGVAVIIAPGGGFNGLAMETEGYRIAHWLADQGIAAFILKYRVNETPIKFEEYSQAQRAAMLGQPSSIKIPEQTPSFALEDGAAALNWVRQHADSFNILPSKVGMMGFSAGAMLTLSLTTTPDHGYLPPDFIALIYGKYDAQPLPAVVPPLFVAASSDDRLFARKGYGLISDWTKQGGSVEFHLYAKGGHGYDLGRTGTTSVAWPQSFLLWIRDQGISSPSS